MNKEYYIPQEQNRFEEHRRFPAELYNKTSDINKIADEIKRQDHEFTTEIKKDKKKSNGEGAVKQIVDRLSKSMSSIVTGVVATATAAVIAVGVYTGITAKAPSIDVKELNTGADYVEYSIEIEGMTQELDYTIEVENPYHSFEREVDSDGVYEGIFTGLRPDLEYTLSVTGEDSGTETIYHQEKLYTSKTDTPVAVFGVETALLQENTVAEISYSVYISDYYKKGSGYYLEAVREGESKPYYVSRELENGFFKGSILDKNGGTTILRAMCSLKGKTFCMGEYKIASPVAVKNEPRIEILGIELSGINQIKVRYKASADKSRYVCEFVRINAIFDSENVWDYDGYSNQLNEESSITVDLEYGFDSVLLEAQLELYDMVKNESVTLYYEEKYALSTQFEYVMIPYLRDGYVEISTKGYLPSDSIIVIEEIGGDVAEFGFYDFKQVQAPDGLVTYNCYVKNSQGDIIIEPTSTAFDFSTPVPEYTFNYKNPTEVQLTYNGDGTMNAYIYTEFESSEENVYYEIELDKTYKLTGKVAVIENIPVSTYPIKYRVIKEIDGIKYVIMHVSPSGVVGETIAHGISATKESEGTVVLTLRDDLEYDFSSIKMMLPGGKEVSADEDSIIHDESNYSYIVFLEHDEAFDHYTVSIRVGCITANYDTISSYVKIKGDILYDYEFTE